MSSNRLSHHHIGAREGSGSIHLPRLFNDDIDYVYYDPDTDCINEARSSLDQAGKYATVYPFCISNKNNTDKFNIMVEPYLSSIFQLSQEFKNFYYISRYKYLAKLDNVMSVDHEIVTEFRSLDQICFSDALARPPHCLTIDAQGATWEVLKGAEKCLREETLCVIAETEMHPLYEGQKTFSEVKSYLESLGFFFCCFDGFMKFGAQSVPTGLRSTNLDIVTNALFLKKPEATKNSGQDKPAIFARLQKLAFYAIIMNQTEIAMDCFARLKKTPQTNLPADVPHYIKFIIEFSKAADKLDQPQLPIFDIQDITKSAGSAVPAARTRSIFRKFIRPLIDKNRRLHHFYIHSRPLIDKLRHLWRAAGLAPTAVEDVLEQYELYEQAGWLRNRRAVAYFK